MTEVPAPEATEVAVVPKRRSWAWEWAKSLLIALVIWFFLRSLLLEAFRIPSGSMENTLLVGDFLFVNKALYGAEVPVIGTRLPAIREPGMDDIVVFISPEDEDMNVVKRIVGMPGDTLSMRNNQLIRNGTAIDEPWAIRSDDSMDPQDPRMRWQAEYLTDFPRQTTYRPSLKQWGPLVVPADSFFVMGDNRDRSYDSRYWGFLGRDRIRGKPLLVYYSYDTDGMSSLPMFTGIRWGRLFSFPD